MPLNIKFGFKKRKGKNSKGGDGNASEASKESTPSRDGKIAAQSPKLAASQGRDASGAAASEGPFGYTEKEVKKLPKLHRAVWNGEFDKVLKLAYSSKYDATDRDKNGR